MITGMAAELLVVRHGETTWNASSRLQGHSDSELNEVGKKQALAVAECLAKEASSITAIYSSDLKRAAHTAQIIADKLGCPDVNFRSSLRERHLGCLQGLTLSEARRLQPEAYKAFASSKDQAIPGGGESGDELCVRARKVAEEIAQQHQGQKVVVVTHGGLLQALRINAKGLPATGKAPNASISVFSISEDSEWRLHTWCDVSHLGEVGFLSSGFGGGKSG